MSGGRLSSGGTWSRARRADQRAARPGGAGEGGAGGQRDHRARAGLGRAAARPGRGAGVHPAAPGDGSRRFPAPLRAWSGCPAGCNAGETRNACRVGSQANNYNYSVTYFRGQRAQGTWYYTPWETQCSGGESNNIGSASRRGGGVGGSGQGSNNTGGPVGGNSGQSAYSLNCPAGTNAQNTTSTANAGQTGATGGIYGARGGDSNCCLGGSGGPWLNVSNTRWANKGASGAIVQKVNIA